jgi:hypothetical protein
MDKNELFQERFMRGVSKELFGEVIQDLIM